VSVALRPYQPSDFEALYLLDRACYPPGIAYSKRMLRWYLAFPGAICTVAEAGDGVIAGFILSCADPPDGHVITLDVAAEFRRHGTGSALYNAAENELVARGVREIELETATGNAAGVAFWTRHGYRADGLLPGYYLDQVDAFHMHKTLDARKSALADAKEP
jgi:[ribosomal protein S18]-alanine N-acetyltransferase